MKTETAPGSALSPEHKELKLAGVVAQARETKLVQGAAKVAKLGDQEPLYAASAILVVVGLLARRRDVAWAGVRVGAAVAAADAFKSVVKRSVVRSRPRTLLDDGRYERHISDGEHGTPEESFPSGHVACTLAAGLALRRTWPQAGPVVAIAVAGLGLTRVLDGEHWPSDVAAGAAIGLAAEITTNGLLDAATRRSHPSSMKRLDAKPGR